MVVQVDPANGVVCSVAIGCSGDLGDARVKPGAS
jgi:hypothetical protein